MMRQFFSVQDNSLSSPEGLPWVEKIVSRFECGSECPECHAIPSEPVGDLEVLLERNAAREWTDIFGCGAHPLFIVSERVLRDWRSDGLGEFPVGGQIVFVPPLPEYLEVIPPPSYFWLDGKRMLGARLDFEASGYVGVRFCSTCGRLLYDIGATYDRQHSKVWPYAFVEGSWNGANLFTVVPSWASFFCTDQVVSCAGTHRHTNFRFVPVEEGPAVSSRGIAYMGNGPEKGTS